MIYFLGELASDGKPNGLVKVGFTDSSSAKGRLGNCQTGNPRALKVLKEIAGTQSQERKLHKLFRDWHRSGEWFAFSSHALRVLTWKRVVDVETFIAALGERYESAWTKEIGTFQWTTRAYPVLPPPALPVGEDDAAARAWVAEGLKDDDLPPEALGPVAYPKRPDGDSDGDGMVASANSAAWRFRVAAARELLEDKDAKELS